MKPETPSHRFGRGHVIQTIPLFWTFKRLPVLLEQQIESPITLSKRDRCLFLLLSIPKDKGFVLEGRCLDCLSYAGTLWLEAEQWPERWPLLPSNKDQSDQ